MSGKSCEIVTGVTIAYPVLEAPGYKLQYVGHKKRKADIKIHLMLIHRSFL